jgi:hypothetical protein
MSSNIAVWCFRIVLILAGLAIIYTGINISFGGILTLGLQGTNDFFQITDQKRFLEQDSHIRFLGGIWFAVGLLFIISSFKLIKFQMALKFCFAAMFIGGLARFTQMQPTVTLGAEILPSLIAEIILMPFLFLWINSIYKKSYVKNT